jgi:hypothetical protein
MSSLIAKLLASKILEKVGKAILLALLRELSKRSTNTIDDEIVKAVEEALK